MRYVPTATLLAVSFGVGTTLAFSVIDANDILVSNDGLIYDYTRSGTLVQEISVPYPDGIRPTTERNRDLIMMDDGRIAVFNGTFSPYLSIYNPSDDTWQHATYPGWTAINSSRMAGIAAYGPYVFVTDARTFGHGGLDEALGVVRFDTRDMSAQRFETTIGDQDVTIGGDGLLYAIGQNSTSVGRVKVFDPVSLITVRTITLNPSASDINSVVVDGQGQITFSTFSGFSVYDSAGNFIRSVATNPADLRDLDLDRDGTLIAATRLNGVIQTNDSLSSPTAFQTTWDPYVAFAHPTPEPASCFISCIAMLLARYRSRRGCLKPDSPGAFGRPGQSKVSG